MNDTWRTLYDAEYPRLVRALAAVSGDAAAAEDAAQEAFVKLYRHGLVGIERPGAWLLVVGSRDVFRSRRRPRPMPLIPEIAPSSADGLDDQISHLDLLEALRRLPQRQRTVVVSRFYYGLSYAEIAAALTISSGTVGATLHQAIRSLRQLYLAGRMAKGVTR